MGIKRICIKEKSLLIIFLLILLSSVHAQSNNDDPNMVSTVFDMNDFPQWAKDLRRGEVVAFGTFPFAYFLANFGVDTYRLAKNGGDRRFAPWPFTAAGEIGKTQDEKFLTLGVTACSAVAIALIDYGIVRYKRSRQEREIRNLPEGTPIIIRKPMYDEGEGFESSQGNSGVISEPWDDTSGSH